MPRILLALLAAVLVLSGCSDGPTEATPDASAPPDASATADDTYVALGDSFTAAPGVPPQSGGLCGRSEVNYPHLLAEQLDLDLTDQSCSGATSQDVLARQVGAVTDETDLVTVSIGGNDDGLFAQLAFGTLDRSGVPRTLRRIERNVGQVLDAVAQAAPQARVVVVSYPRLLPARGSCPDRVPFRPDDYRFIDGVNRDLVEAQRTAAERAGVGFADVFAASEGHDICSDDAWVNGGETAPDGTIPFHPFAVGERGMADVVAPLLQR